ncbi:MAG: hypothetical protein ACE364_07325 [Chlorobiota bacterium]
MNKIPNLYLLSTLLCALAILMVAFTKIHFVIIFMVLGGVAYLPNFWLFSIYGLKVTLYVKEYEPNLYNEYKSLNFLYKDVFLLSPIASKSKDLLEVLDEEHQYALKKYSQAFGNAIYTFFLLALSLILASFFI